MEHLHSSPSKASFRSRESFLFESCQFLGLRSALEEDKDKHDDEKQAIATKLRALPMSGLEQPPSTLKRKLRQRALFVGQIVLFLIIIVQFIMLYKNYMFAAACGVANAGVVRKQAASSSTSSLPDYYQTKPELFPGTKETLNISITLN